MSMNRCYAVRLVESVHLAHGELDARATVDLEAVDAFVLQLKARHVQDDVFAAALDVEVQHLVGRAPLSLGRGNEQRYVATIAESSVVQMHGKGETVNANLQRPSPAHGLDAE
jgi:hypothetical protein